jgi:type I restriction enzyme R subunit
MLDHFVPQVVNTKKLRGKAKGMIITQNIEAAIRYFKAVTKLLDGQGNPFKVLIAFSGEKTVDGMKYTEAEMNGFPESETREKFDTDDYRLLIVANKYLTGFDQPKLTAMYVDKKLQFVLAVQALSRLNRSAPKLGKRTEDLFILDFFNSVDDIKTAFDPFYTVTTLSGATDVNVLHELKDALDQVGVYEWQEVEDFVTRYFAGEDAQNLSPIIDIAANRFNTELELPDPEKIDFKIKAKQFVKIYGQMASIIPFEVLEWEKLFWLLKFLIPKLKIKDPNEDMMDELLEAVDLSSYGLERTKLNHEIGLDASDTELEPQNPNPRGNRDGEVQADPLDAIVASFNEKWFQGWSATPEEQRVKFVNIVNSIKAHPDYEAKYHNNSDPFNRSLALEKMLQDVMLTRRKEELDLYRLFASDPAFKAAWSQNIEKILSGEMGSVG